MVKQMYEDIYRIRVPLPKNPLKELNSYVIKGQERNLVIDTGFNRKESQIALEEGFNKLDIDLNKTDFFITHMHADHAGLIDKVVTPHSRVYCSKQDGDVIALGQNMPFWQHLSDFVSQHGFPSDEQEYAIDTHPGFKYCCKGFNNFTYIKDQDVIEINGYKFFCIETPGHTKGHMCLYEPHKKILISGDHILGSITPNIGLWSNDYNPLDMYIKSLDKIYKLEVEITLPSHREPIANCRERITELKLHHRHRLDEVLDIVGVQPQNACQIAAKMKWDLTYETWDEFPTPQKWFAISEALAHIKYLVELSDVTEIIEGDTYMYRRNL